MRPKLELKIQAHTRPAATVLVTTGHEGLATLLARDDCRLLVRLIEPPEAALPPHARLLLGRPPYRLEQERALFAREGITHLLTKNSGGTATAAKLEAAREAGAEVVMLRRPAYGPAQEAESVDEALRAAMALESINAPIFEALLTRYSLSAFKTFTWVE